MNWSLYICITVAANVCSLRARERRDGGCDVGSTSRAAHGGEGRYEASGWGCATNGRVGASAFGDAGVTGCGLG
jgi:hypothetical protein